MNVAVPLLATASAAGHVIYPTLLGLATWGKRQSDVGEPAFLPAVTVIIPAYLEANVIEEKIADIERQRYPAAIEIIVVADDAQTSAAARRAGARVLHQRDRTGKSRAVNVGVAAASYDIVVLSDANVALAPGALELLARHFTDPTVGAVAGAKHVVDAAGQGFYWRFESWLKQRETLLGSTLGVVGELVAFRREAFRPLPEALVGDDLWLALDMIEGGWQVLLEPEARALEYGSPTIHEEWERRTRIVAGTIDVIWRRRWLLVPGRSHIAGQLWGHKLLRSTVGPVAHVALLGSAAASVRRSRVAQLALLGHAVSGVALAHVARGGKVPRLLQMPVQVLFLQGVALGGLLRYLRGDRPSVWPKLERGALSESATDRYTLGRRELARSAS